jgi:hypothetical protein
MGSEHGPVAIGGVGGSGTRVVARMLSTLRFHLGGDLNEAHDNLWFTLLFKRREALSVPDAAFQDLVAIFEKAMNGGSPFSQAQRQLLCVVSSAAASQFDPWWIQLRTDSLLRRPISALQHEGWGWKEPNTHVVLERINRSIAGLRYIHVVRNGLDMAYSSNQNQVKLWRSTLFGVSTDNVSPRTSLKYWRAVHDRTCTIGAKMPGRFLLVNYDRLCASPEPEISTLLEFLGIKSSFERIAALREHLHPAATIGRYRQFSSRDFDAEDIAYVRSLGFVADYENGRSITTGIDGSFGTQSNP